METLPAGGILAADGHLKSLKKSESNIIPSSPVPQRLSSVSQPQSSQSFTEKKQNADFDSEVYSAGQSLASILNNPHLGKAGVYSSDASWSSWFFSSSTDGLEASPSVPLKALPEIGKVDFLPYLNSIAESYSRFSDVREHSNWEQNNQASAVTANGNLADEDRAQGEGLVACLREIPSLYFSEDFALEDGATFQAACPYSSIPQNVMLQEKLSHYLDVVEVHLVKEISARSDSFFEAQGQLENLNSVIVEACEQIGGLKATVQLLDADVVESARRIQTLSQQRDKLLSLHEKLKLMSYVNQALNDLPLLLAAADCGGALDVIDDLQHVLEGDELVGLHCFRNLGHRLASSIDAINSMLAADFVRAAIHDNKDLLSSVILGKFRKRDLLYITTAKEGFLAEDKEQEEEEEEESGLRDQLLPLVIGLLRTSKLPAILRVYKDTLITDIKAAIKSVVAELLPSLLTWPLDRDLQSAERQGDLEIGGVSLASKLRSLSPESFVQLLAAVFDVVQVRLLRAAEVRKVVEQIVGGLQGSYAAAAVAAAFASGAAAAAAAEAAAEAAQEDQQNSAILVPARKVSSKYSSSFSREIEAPSPTTISRNFRADVLLENTEAVCAACLAAHERWAKLLGVRAIIHPKLRLQEFVNIQNITQVFMSTTEKVGGRYASSIRGTLHSQCRAFVDVQHNNRMSKINAVLEQEMWVTVDAPDEFQILVNSFIDSEPSINGSLTSDQSAVSISEKRPSNLYIEASSGQAPDESSILERAASPFGRISRQNSVESANVGSESSDVSPLSADQNISSVKTARTEANNITNVIELKNAHVQSNVQPEDAITTDTVARSKKAREKPALKTLHIRGVGYHMVNSGLILLKMLAEYVDISTTLPIMASEVVHRVAEILKLFNSRTCQLVLGAGAMQVSGLKSITAKHLALASQSISFFLALIPDMRRVLSAHIPEARKILLLTEIDRVAQDYRVHRDEIHSKLVQIMKERLMVHLRTLPQIAETWNKSDDQDIQPSQFARALTKEVGVLHRVLSPLLLDSDVRSIFTLVIALFHLQLAEAFSKLEMSSSASKHRLYRDIQHILACIRGLPSDAVISDGTQKPGELDEFLQQRYGKDVPD